MKKTNFIALRVDDRMRVELLKLAAKEQETISEVVRRMIAKILFARKAAKR